MKSEIVLKYDGEISFEVKVCRQKMILMHPNMYSNIIDNRAIDNLYMWPLNFM